MPSSHQGALGFYEHCLSELPKQGTGIKVSGMNRVARYQGIRSLPDVRACSSPGPSLSTQVLGQLVRLGLPSDTQAVPLLGLKKVKMTWSFCAVSEG